MTIICNLAHETLEKSREVFKRLKDEKQKLQTEMEEKLKQTEKAMEEEKENLVQELSRAKQTAVSCLQVEGAYRIL